MRALTTAKVLAKRHGVVRIDDWDDFDPTGVANMSTIAQQWQDQSLAANRVAVAPGNALIRLNSKVTFKVPTEGNWGMGLQSGGGTRGQPTTFVNGGINDGTWMIEIPTDVAANYNFHSMRSFRLFNNAATYTCAGMRAVGAIGVGAMQSWEWYKINAYGFTVNLEAFGWNGVLNQCVSRQASITCMRWYQPNGCTVLGGWYGSGKTGGSDMEILSDVAAAGGFANFTILNTCFQPESITGVSHGLRICEGGVGVRVSGYFEKHKGSTSVKAWALDVGTFNGVHPSGATPIALDFDGENFIGANAPNNAHSRAVKDLDISGSIMGGGSGNTNADLGPRVRFGNVHGLELGKACLGAKEMTFSALCFDVNGFPRSIGINSLVSDTRHHVYTHYQQMRVVDELNRFGKPTINILPLGNFPGSGPQALRAVEDCNLGGATAVGRVTWDSDNAITYDGKPTLKVTRTGDSVGSVPARMYLFPYGSASRTVAVGEYIAISGMIRVKSAAGYDANPVGSTATSMAFPSIGLAYTDAGGTFSSRSHLGFTGADGDKYFKVDTWTPFFQWWRVTDTAVAGGITRVGLTIAPIGDEAYAPTVDHQINLANLAICINPLSFSDVRSGIYQHSDLAGRFVGEKFHVTATVPGGANVNLQQGDVFWNPAPTTGNPPGWVVTTTGNGATANNHCAMANLGATI